MNFQKIKSHAKINIALNINGKSRKFHNIETIIAFVDLHDLIYIKKIKSKNHRISFLGKHSKNIYKNNTVIKLLKILEQKNLLKRNKFEIKIFNSLRYKTKNTHGTGCTLSSAITTFLSCGKPVKKSCDLGIKYVNSAIKSNPNYGKGHGPVNHLTSFKINRKFK